MARRSKPPGERDELDDSLDVWAREIRRPRSGHRGGGRADPVLAKGFDRSLEETLAKSGLDRRAFHVLGKLRRGGPPYQNSAGQLAMYMRLSSGAMTNRLDRMEAAGLIRRLPDPNDRRGTLIEPTELGHQTWDRTVGTQAMREAKMASVLDAESRDELHALLRTLMRAFPDKHQHGHKAAEAAEAPDLPEDG